MAAVAIDSSVILALFDQGDAAHFPCVDAVAGRRESGWVLAASVLSEVLVSAAQGGEERLQRVRARVLQNFGPVRPIDESVAVEAARLRSRRNGLRLPDALLLATASVDDVAEVLTCDRRWASILPNVTVIEVP